MPKIIRLLKRGVGRRVAPAAAIPPTPAPGTGNPIFHSDATVCAEAKRQLALISEELNTLTKSSFRVTRQNLLHVLRGIIDADRRGVAIKMSTRDFFVDTERTSVVQTGELLVELETAGYLDIAAKGKKNHDYRASHKAYDAWNSVKLYEAYSPTGPANNPGSPVGRKEHYLVPFDAQLYLDFAPPGKPEDLEAHLSNYQLIPCGQGTIGVYVAGDLWNRRTPHIPLLVDLRDQVIQPDDLRSAFHTRLYRYFGTPRLGDDLDKLWAEVPGRKDSITPRYVKETGPDGYGQHGEIIFRGKQDRHYEVPRVFLEYLYNNYFGDDLDIRISSRPTSSKDLRTCTLDRFLITVSRSGSSQPLLLYRIEQVREDLATIT